MKRTRLFVLLLVAFVLATPPAPTSAQRGPTPAVKPAAAASQARSTRLAPVTAKTGMVASAHALASQAGVEILKAGGNAVDAAVAAAFAIGVVEPNATGLGGEGMMVIHLASSKKTVAIDYRSTAPREAKFTGPIPATGHAAVAVPGTVAGLVLAQQKYGKLKLATVIAPAALLAEQGFVVSPTLAGILVDNFEEIAKNEALSKVICPGGLPVEAGATLKNPELAASLRAIGAGGADVFYRGAIADRIVAEMAARGGFITKDDLGSYRAIEREPVRGSYRGYDIVSAPPPVAGMTVVEILQILDQLDVSKLAHFSPQHVHLFAEAMKRGFADYSAFIGDPDFTKVPTEFLLSPGYAKQRAAEIDPAAISATVAPASLPKEKDLPPGIRKDDPPSTTSLSVVDGQGNMVALTQTISDFFGSKVMIAGTGIILNNEMKNFSVQGTERHGARQADAHHDLAHAGLPPGAFVRHDRHARRRAHHLDDDAAAVEPDRLQDGHPGSDRGAALLHPGHGQGTVDRGAGVRPDGRRADRARLLGEETRRVRPVLRRSAGDRHRPRHRPPHRRRRPAARRGGHRVLTMTMQNARCTTKKEHGRSTVMIRRTFSLSLLALLVVVPIASAQATFERPGLLTSVGQSSDLAIVKVVLNTQLKLDLLAKPLATPADLQGMKTMVVVVGASTKGLGAAGLDVEKEVARGGALLKSAKEKGVKVIVLHTGGEARRGKTSNDMIEAVMPGADYVVVVAAGNKDKLFNTLAGKRNVPVVEVEKATALADAIKPIFK